MTTTKPEEVPIACTLGGAAYGERVAWIAQLNRDGLRGHRRNARSLELEYAVEVRDRVHELVRLESACCSFLNFSVDESEDRVRITIMVPERAEDLADALLVPFLGGTDPAGTAETGQCASGDDRCCV